MKRSYEVHCAMIERAPEMRAPGRFRAGDDAAERLRSGIGPVAQADARHRVVRRLMAVIILAFWTFGAWAQTRVALEEGSRLVIDGVSTVNRFNCSSEVLTGEATIGGHRAEAYLTVPVATFDCGHSRMNRDLQRAMKAPEHPEIRFELVGADSVAGDERFSVRGLLTIAGVTREIAVQPQIIENAEDRYRIQGEKRLKMSEFGLKPPTALAGLIRVRDEIVVRYDVFVRTAPDSGRPATGLQVWSSRSDRGIQRISN